MSTLHAEEIPLPQSRQSPSEQGHGIGESELETSVGRGGDVASGNENVEAPEQPHVEEDGRAEATVDAAGSGDQVDGELAEQSGNGDSEGQEPASLDNEHTDTDGSPLVKTISVSSSAMRPPTPLSRTSTPPLSSGSGLAGAKKFSRVNVNKKFLSKGASPAAGTPATATKLGLTSACCR